MRRALLALVAAAVASWSLLAGLDAIATARRGITRLQLPKAKIERQPP